jgi:hypothetical protein
MAKISVLYDFHEDGIKPYTMIIRFKQGEDMWKKPYLYIPLQAPFHRFMATDFADGVQSVAIILEMLTVNPEKPNMFGIDVWSLRSLIDLPDTNYTEIEQFIIRICDIEDVLQMEVQRNYAWEV